MPPLEGILKVDTHGSVHSKDWEIMLNGISIQKYVRCINLELAAGKPPEILIQFVARLDIPAEIKGLITTYQQALPGNSGDA
jgi:uncharacterized protein (UPF0276 family)